MWSLNFGSNKSDKKLSIVYLDSHPTLFRKSGTKNRLFWDHRAPFYLVTIVFLIAWICCFYPEKRAFSNKVYIHMNGRVYDYNLGRFMFFGPVWTMWFLGPNS